MEERILLLLVLANVRINPRGIEPIIVMIKSPTVYFKPGVIAIMVSQQNIIISLNSKKNSLNENNSKMYGYHQSI